jgi:hypothetical protein
MTRNSAKKIEMTTQTRTHIMNWIRPSFSAEIQVLSYGADKFGYGKS